MTTTKKVKKYFFQGSSALIALVVTVQHIFIAPMEPLTAYEKFVACLVMLLLVTISMFVIEIIFSLDASRRSTDDKPDTNT